MPNGYTVFPNILPGNVTIGGNLTISGDQLTIGAAAPFVRLGKQNGRITALFSQNLGFDALTRDVVDFSEAILLDSNSNSTFHRRLNSAGGLQDSALSYAIFTDYTTHAHTGTTTEDTIYSKVIPANTIGPNGGLRVWVQTKGGSNGATQTIGRARLGGTQLINILADATGLPQLIHFEFRNRNATNAQDVMVHTTNLGNGTVAGATNTVAVDTTVDQTLTITIQNGTSTDTQNFVMCIAEQMNSFGPV